MLCLNKTMALFANKEMNKKLIIPLFFLLISLGGCIATSLSGRSNGMDKTNINYGLAIGPVSNSVYVSPSYGLTKNSDLGVDLEVGEHFVSERNADLFNRNDLSTSAIISPWYKYSFHNDPTGFASAIKLTAGVGKVIKGERVNSTASKLNLNYIVSYKSQAWEPYFVTRFGAPDLLGFSSGTSYWFNKKQAFNIGINTTYIFPNSISFGYQQAID